jgi:hypothetical protein
MVTAHEEYTGAFTPRKAVQTITTSMDEDYAPGHAAAQQISGFWHAQWKRYKDENVWEMAETRPIPAAATSDDVKAIMEADFGIEEVLVTRSNADVRGGYTWTVTFVSVVGEVTALEAYPDDNKPLTPADGGVDIVTSLVHPVAPKLRGNAYVYTRDEFGGQVGTGWGDRYY